MKTINHMKLKKQTQISPSIVAYLFLYAILTITLKSINTYSFTPTRRHNRKMIPPSISTRILKSDSESSDMIINSRSCPTLYYTVRDDLLDIGFSDVVASTDEDVSFISVEETVGFESSESIFVENQPFKKSLASHLNTENSKMVSQPCKVVGHRGHLYRSLENTRHSIRLAAEHCHEVEIDVFLLKCGTLIVFHGGGTDQNPGCLKDYCNKNASILDLTYVEVLQLEFNPNYNEFGCGPDVINKLSKEQECYIPTLHDVLSDAKETGVVIKIELKGPGTADPVLKLVERLNMIDHVHYSSFEHSRIKRIRELRPDRKMDGSYRYKTGALFDEVPDNFVDMALDVGASEVHLKYSECTAEIVNSIHQAGMDSMIWMRGPIGMKDDVTHRFHDVGNEDEAMYLAILKTGVKAMCVNRPDVLMNLLKKIVWV